MTGRNARQNVIATFGNYGLYTAAQDVFSSDGECLVSPGQPVIYNPRTLKSLGTGITVSSNPEIVIGVGVDTNGDGVSDTIRATFGDKLYGYHITAASAEAPACGLNPIKDFFFDCTHYDDSFTLAVGIEDQQSRSELTYNSKFTYIVNVKIEKQPCDTCDSGVSCKVVSCKIVDAFRGVYTGQNKNLRDTFTKDAIERQLAAAKFEVVPLYGSEDLDIKTTKDFCVSMVAGACDNCIDTNFLFTTATYTDENSVLQTLTFTNIANAAGTATLSAQLKRVVSQINKKLNGNGYAVLMKNTGMCCPYRIQVNTCYADFAITGLAPCATTNPFDFTTIQELACKTCEVSSAVAPPKCGVRFIAKPVEFECGKYPITNPIVNFTQKLDVYPVTGFKDGQWLVKDIQLGSNPINQGYHWQYIDYITDNGGLGRTQNGYNDTYGNLGLPGDNDRAGSSLIKCGVSYCSYDIHHNLPYKTTDVHGGKIETQGLTSIIVPSGDSTTKTDLQAFFTSYLPTVPNLKIVTITCASDQDQDGGTYPDYNGNRNI